MRDLYLAEPASFDDILAALSTLFGRLTLATDLSASVGPAVLAFTLGDTGASARFTAEPVFVARSAGSTAAVVAALLAVALWLAGLYCLTLSFHALAALIACSAVAAAPVSSALLAVALRHTSTCECVLHRVWIPDAPHQRNAQQSSQP